MLKVSYTNNWLAGGRSSLMGILISGLVVGCSDSHKPVIKQFDNKELFSRIHVIAQICDPSSLPSNPVKEFIGWETVHKKSLGKGAVNVVGATQANQAVFEKFAGEVSDLKAIVVPISNDLRYVFVPPTNLSYSHWSSWEPPKFQSTYRSAAFEIMYDRPLHKYPVGQNALKARYILMSFDDYLHSNRKAAAVNIPAC